MARADPNDRLPDESAWTQPRFLIAGGIVGVIAVLGLVLALSGHGGSSGSGKPTAVAQTSSSQTASSSTSSSSTTVSSSANPNGCSLSAGSQTVPTSAPSGTQWQLVGEMAAPSAPSTIGPQHTVDGFHVCFADSPLGALYAAVNVWAVGTAYPFATVLERLGANMPTLRPDIAGEKKTPNARINGNSQLQVAAFSFVSYSATSATIDLVFQAAGTSTGLLSLPTSLEWQDSDWRYVAPPNDTPSYGQVPNLNGFIAWSDAQ